jgi:hypothetical protein
MSVQPGIQYSDDGAWWWDGSQWRAVATDPPPAPSAMAAPAPTSAVGAAEDSPSVIALTWPHRFVQPGTRHRYQVPCGGPVMDGHDVAKLVVALPLVRLWREGVIGMEVATSKKLMLTFTTVKVWQIQQAEVFLVEAELMNAMGREQSVEGVVRRWIAADRSDPWGYVQGVAMAHAAQTGVYLEVDAQRSGLSALFQGKHANSLAQVWGEFAASEPALFGTLLDKVGSAINSRTEQSDNSGSFD